MSDSELTELQPVEPGFRHVLRIQLLLFWLPLFAGAVAMDRLLLSGTALFGLPSTAVPLIALTLIAVAPERTYRRLSYGLNERLLQVVRGWLFHTDTVVPFVRVQHLDVRRGPLDKIFGTATLVVHTAGTHNSVVMVPGLSPQRAAEIRDIIREHVRTDFA